MRSRGTFVNGFRTGEHHNGKGVRYKPQALNIATENCEKAMRLMVEDMDNADLDKQTQYAARLTILRYGYGNPLPMSEMKEFQEELGRDNGVEVKLTPSIMKDVADGAILRVMEALYEKGTMQTFMQMKEEEKASEVKEGVLMIEGEVK